MMTRMASATSTRWQAARTAKPSISILWPQTRMARVEAIEGAPASACNYVASANVDDGSCEFESCAGCLSESACNYEPNALYASVYILKKDTIARNLPE